MNLTRLVLGICGAGLVAGQAGAADDSWNFSVFRMLRIEEYKSRASIDSSLTTHNKHLVNIVFQRVDSGNPQPPPDHSDYYLHSYKFILQSAAEVGTTPTPTQGSPLTLMPTQGQTFEVHVVSTTSSFAIPSTQLQFQVEDDWGHEHWDTGNGQWVAIDSGTYYTNVTMQVNKTICYDASIDSRTAYGEPNQDGVIPGDPNADPRNVNFGSWVYKGGLFVGFAPFTSGDQSGLARIQLYAQGSVGSPACLVMTDAGITTKYSGAMTVGAFIPGSNTPATSESTVTWSNRWPITPSAGSAVSTVTLANSFTAPDYLMWQLGWYGSNTTPSVGCVCLAMTNETVTNVWHYLASREYQALFTSNDIMSDCQPRIWNVGQVATGYTGRHW